MSISFHRAAFESICYKILYLFTRLAIPPMVLSQVGLAEYGLWSIAFVLVGYLGLSVSGLATVYVREIAQAYTRHDAQHASGMLSTGVALALLIGGLFCLGLAFGTPWLLAVFKVNPHLQNLASTLIITATLVFLADLTLGAWGYVLHGLNRVHEQQRIWVASFMLEWLVMTSLLVFHLAMHALLIAFVVRYTFSILCAWWRVKVIWPQLQLNARFVHRRYLHVFLDLGLKSQISDTCAMLLHSADKILAAMSFGSASSAIVDLGSKLPATAISIVSGISTVILPRAACMTPTQLAEFYPKALRLATLTLLPIMPVMIACAPALMLAWLGPKSEFTLILGTLLCLTPAWHCHILTGCASSALRGQGQIHLEFVYHALRAMALALAFSVASNLMQFIELLALGACLSALVYLWLASQALALQGKQLIQLCLAPILLSYSLAYSFYLCWPWHATQRGEAVYELLEAGVVFLLILLGAVWAISLNQQEKSSLLRLALRLFKREVNHA